MSLHRQALANKDQQQPISLKRHGSSVLLDSDSEDDEPAAITSLNGKTPAAVPKRGKVAGKGKAARPQAKKTKTKTRKNVRDSDEFDDSDISDRANVTVFGGEDVEDETDEGAKKIQPTKSRTKTAPKKNRGVTKRKRKTDD